jgi:alcohol dehydrogenase (cytochrome c)
MDVLTTASGLLFTGSLDASLSLTIRDRKRVVAGGSDWRPHAAPITYSVDGKQYIAMVTGYGNPFSRGIPALTPEIQLPAVNSSAVFVFALPDTREQP